MHDDLPIRAAGASETRFRLPRGSRVFPRRGRSPLCWLALAALISSSVGCSISTTVRALCGPYEEHKRRTALKLGAEMEARRIWTECYAEHYQERPGEEDFRQGFVTAFVETALGRTGCPPPVPTSPLISWNTVTHSFPDANVWYAGYHLGHASALANGVDRRRLAPVNPELLAQAQPHRPAPEVVDLGGELLESLEVVEPPVGVPEEEFEAGPMSLPPQELIPPDGSSTPDGSLQLQSIPSPRHIE